MIEPEISPFKTVLYEKIGPIAHVTLSRPRFLNAINIQMRDDLYHVLRAIKDDPDVLVAIIKGAGDRAFSAGADLTEFGTAPSVVIARQSRWQRDLWGLFLSVSKPLIAAVHGYALGAGVEMALCCDIRVASDDAELGLPEVAFGMVPAAGGSQTLPRTIGPGRAMHLLLTADRISAQQAYEIGLVNRVTSRDDLYPTAEAIADKIASNGPIALRYAKEAISKGQNMTLADGLEVERNLFALLQTTEDRREGITAFLEKRKPQFRNR